MSWRGPTSQQPLTYTQYTCTMTKATEVTLWGNICVMSSLVGGTGKKFIIGLVCQTLLDSLGLPSGHDYIESLIPVWLSQITSLLRLRYWYPGLALITNMCPTHSVYDKAIRNTVTAGETVTSVWTNNDLPAKLESSSQITKSTSKPHTSRCQHC